MFSQFSHLCSTYAFANNYTDNRDENNNVPRILHFLWVFQPIPEKYLDAITGFEKNNPDYEVRYKYRLYLTLSYIKKIKSSIR